MKMRSLATPRNTSTALAALVLVLSTSMGWAENTANGPDESSVRSSAGHQGKRAGQMQQQQNSAIRVVAASKIVGRDLKDAHGNDAGRVSSLVIDAQSGAIDYVMINPPSSFNAGGQLIAAPWQALKTPFGSEGSIGVTLGVNELAQAPRIDPRLIRRLERPWQRSRIYGYYGYYGYRGYGYRYGPGPGPVVGAYGPPPNARDMAGTDEASGDLSQQMSSDRQNSNQHAQPDQTSGAGTLVVGEDGVVDTLEAGKTTSASALRDAAVYGDAGSAIGHIDEVIIDTNRGKVAYVLLARGGFLGMGESWFALPIEALARRNYAGGGGYRLTVDQALLTAEPTVPFDRQNTPTRVSTAQLAMLYGHFGIQPYWEQSGQQRSAAQGTPSQTTGRAVGSEHEESTQAVGNAELQAFELAAVPIATAISTAEKHSGGDALDITFDVAQGRPVYQVTTYQKQEIWEGTIDAQTGKVVGAGKTTAESQLDQEDKAELAELQNATTTLPEAISIAEKRGNGKAMSAGLEQKNGNVVYEVTVAAGDTAQKIVVDPSNGQVTDAGAPKQ